VPIINCKWCQWQSELEQKVECNLLRQPGGKASHPALRIQRCAAVIPSVRVYKPISISL